MYEEARHSWWFAEDIQPDRGAEVPEDDIPQMETSHDSGLEAAKDGEGGAADMAKGSGLASISEHEHTPTGVEDSAGYAEAGPAKSGTIYAPEGVIDAIGEGASGPATSEGDKG